MFLRIKSFIKKEAVLCISALLAVATVFLVPPDKEYIEYIDIKVLCLLLCLMAVVEGFKAVGMFKWLTFKLLSNTYSGRTLGISLVLLPFFCSMLVTNDVALIVFVPFTIALLSQLGFVKSIIPVIVMQTVAANLGSMATPVGNPQNLYLFSAYNLTPEDFFSVTLPLTAISLIVLAVSSVFLLPKKFEKQNLNEEKISDKRNLIIYIFLFILCLLTVFKIVNYIITTVIVVVLFLIIDRKILKNVDYLLLVTFVCFFIVSGNLGRIEVIRDFLHELLKSSTLFTSVGASQVISNVPAAVLLSEFTEDWKNLLSGVNIGGLGTPIASLASLITLKIYTGSENSNIGRFLLFFTFVNIIGLIILLTFSNLLS